MSPAETELEMTKRHVRDGKQALARQRRLIADLEARGENTELAHKLLDDFESIQRLHQDHLDRIRAR